MPAQSLTSCALAPTTIHLHPTAELAERVLLPGDPGRALLLAQSLLEAPKMFNHNRGLWGYTGTAVDGAPLTIQSTGMGGPSAAIVISELARLGAARLLRVGTCGALDRSLRLGEIVIATESIAADGTSRALGAGTRAAASPELLGALLAAASSASEQPSSVAALASSEPLAASAGAEPSSLSVVRAGSEQSALSPGSVRAGLVASTDLFYDAANGREQEWLSAGALAVEMESATLFALAARQGLDAGSLLVVSDIVLPSRARIDPEALRSAEQRMGELAVRALAC